VSLLIAVGGLIFAAALAAGGTVSRAKAAPAGSPVRRRKSLVTEFGQQLIVSVPLTLLAILVYWFLSGPYFNPPHGAIRW